MLRALPLALAGVLMFVAGCGGGGSTSQTPSVDFEAAARQAATDALMTLADMPEFWSEGTEEDGNFELELSAECDVFDPQVGFPGSVVVEESGVFLGSGELQARFTTAVFREEEAAEAAFDGQDALVEMCDEEFLEAIEQAAREEAAERGFELGPLARLEVELGETDFAALADGTQARRAEVTVTVAGISTRFLVDIVTVRSGRMLGVMIYSNFLSLDGDEEEEIAATMSGKLESADGTLPE